MEIVFATTNKEKFNEAQLALSSAGFSVKMLSYEMMEPGAGTTEEVALFKLNQVKDNPFECIMVDDAGMYLTAYDDFPGILAKRIFNQIGYKGVSKLLKDEERNAWFQGSVAVSFRGKVRVFSEIVHGKIIHYTDEIEGNQYFPFDHIFVPNGSDKVISEMSPEDKVKYSYRNRCFLRAAKWICTTINDSTN